MKALLLRITVLSSVHRYEIKFSVKLDKNVSIFNDELYAILVTSPGGTN